MADASDMVMKEITKAKFNGTVKTVTQMGIAHGNIFVDHDTRLVATSSDY